MYKNFKNNYKEKKNKIKSLKDLLLIKFLYIRRGNRTKCDYFEKSEVSMS